MDAQEDGVAVEQDPFPHILACSDYIPSPSRSMERDDSLSSISDEPDHFTAGTSHSFITTAHSSDDDVSETLPLFHQNTDRQLPTESFEDPDIDSWFAVAYKVYPYNETIAAHLPATFRPKSAPLLLVIWGIVSLVLSAARHAAHTLVGQIVIYALGTDIVTHVSFSGALKLGAAGGVALWVLTLVVSVPLILYGGYFGTCLVDIEPWGVGNIPVKSDLMAQLKTAAYMYGAAVIKGVLGAALLEEMEGTVSPLADRTHAAFAGLMGAMIFSAPSWYVFVTTTRWQTVPPRELSDSESMITEDEEILMPMHELQDEGEEEVLRDVA